MNPVGENLSNCPVAPPGDEFIFEPNAAGGCRGGERLSRLQPRWLPLGPRRDPERRHTVCERRTRRLRGNFSRKSISRAPASDRAGRYFFETRAHELNFLLLIDETTTDDSRPTRCAPLRSNPPRPLGPLTTHTVPADITRYSPPIDSHLCSGRSRPRGGGPAALRAGWRPRAARKPPVARACASWGGLRTCARRGGGLRTASYRGRARVRGSGRGEREHA